MGVRLSIVSVHSIHKTKAGDGIVIFDETVTCGTSLQLAKDQWEGSMIRQFVGCGRISLDAHPTLDKVKLALLEDIRLRADGDYIAAARDFAFGDMSHFYWNAAQAIEKLCKVALRLNGEKPPATHNVVELYSLLIDKMPQKLILPLAHKFRFKTTLSCQNSVSEFLGDIARYGATDARYYEGYVIDRAIDKLQRVLFGLRRVAYLPLDYPLDFYKPPLLYGVFLEHHRTKPLQLMCDERNSRFLAGEKGRDSCLLPIEAPVVFSARYCALDVHIRIPLEADIAAGKRSKEGKLARNYGRWVYDHVNKLHGDLGELHSKHDAL